MSLPDAFRCLRHAWFNAKLLSCAHEREWETEESEQRRVKRNADLRTVYDEQTEQIISGKDCLGVSVAPYCPNDMTARGANDLTGAKEESDANHPTPVVSGQ